MFDTYKIDMQTLNFGLIATQLPVPDMVKIGIAAEKYGFDSVWVPDHYVDIPPSGDMVDPWVVLSAIASHTKKIMLSTAATDVLRYHPSKLAHIVATLDQLSHGRAMVGIGAGEVMNVVPFGIKWEKSSERILRVRETIEVMKMLWSSSIDRRVNYKGKYYMLENAWLDLSPLQKPHPKVFVAALASNTLLAVAGEVGDGWLSGYTTIEKFREMAKIVKSAASLANRDPDSIRLAAWIPIILSKDRRTLEMARNAVAPEVLLCARKMLKDYGIEIPNEIFGDSNIPYSHIIPNKEIAYLATKFAHNIPAELIEEFVACGDHANVTEFLDKYRKEGATDIILRDVVGLMVKKNVDAVRVTLREFSKKVIPHFR